MFPRPRPSVQEFRRHWFAIEAVPLYLCVSGMVGAGLWYLIARVARGPDVIWTRRNPAPWMTVAQNETTKLGTKLGPRLDASGTPQHKWDKRWSRLEHLPSESKKGEQAKHA